MYRRVYRERPDADRSSRTFRRRRALGAVDDRHAQENRLMAPERMSGGVIWHVTMSVDGFIAGPNDSMDWVVAQWSDHGVNTRDIDVQRSALADEILHAAGGDPRRAAAGTTSLFRCSWSRARPDGCVAGPAA